MSNDKWHFKTNKCISRGVKTRPNSLDCTDYNQCGVRRDAELCRFCYKRGVKFSEELTSLVYIKLANKGKVLGITDKNEVIDETVVPNDIRQMWIVGPTNNKGYFNLINLHSQQLLTANSSDELEMIGMRYRNSNSNQLSFHFSFFPITLDKFLIDKGNHDGTSPLHLSAVNWDSLSTR